MSEYIPEPITRATVSGSDHFPNSGNELCISNQTANFDYHGIDGDDYWIFISDNPAKCT